MENNQYFSALLGLPKNDSSLQSFLSQFKTLEKSFPTKSGENHLYISSYEAGISFEFINDVLTNVYIYNENDKKFSKNNFNHLPYDIHLDYTNDEIISIFGEPDQKNGGKMVNISIIYDKLGVEVNFHSNSWAFPKAKISYLCFFQENKEKKRICGVCGGEGEFLCGGCQIVGYCGGVCQKKHWIAHKRFCGKKNK